MLLRPTPWKIKKFHHSEVTGEAVRNPRKHAGVWGWLRSSARGWDHGSWGLTPLASGLISQSWVWAADGEEVWSWVRLLLNWKNISNSQELECLKRLGHQSPLLAFPLFHATVSVTSRSMILAGFLSGGDLWEYSRWSCSFDYGSYPWSISSII